MGVIRLTIEVKAGKMLNVIRRTAVFRCLTSRLTTRYRADVHNRGQFLSNSKNSRENREFHIHFKSEVPAAATSGGIITISKCAEITGSLNRFRFAKWRRRTPARLARRINVKTQRAAEPRETVDPLLRHASLPSAEPIAEGWIHCFENRAAIDFAPPSRFSKFREQAAV